MGKPKCGWRYEVCNSFREVVTIWATFSEAKSSMLRNGSSGWAVRHEGTGEILATISDKPRHAHIVDCSN